MCLKSLNCGFIKRLLRHWDSYLSQLSIFFFLFDVVTCNRLVVTLRHLKKIVGAPIKEQRRSSNQDLLGIKTKHLAFKALNSFFAIDDLQSDTKENLLWKYNNEFSPIKEKMPICEMLASLYKNFNDHLRIKYQGFDLSTVPTCSLSLLSLELANYASFSVMEPGLLKSSIDVLQLMYHNNVPGLTFRCKSYLDNSKPIRPYLKYFEKAACLKTFDVSSCYSHCVLTTEMPNGQVLHYQKQTQKLNSPLILKSKRRYTQEFKAVFFECLKFSCQKNIKIIATYSHYHRRGALYINKFPLDLAFSYVSIRKNMTTSKIKFKCINFHDIFSHGRYQIAEGQTCVCPTPKQCIRQSDFITKSNESKEKDERLKTILASLHFMNAEFKIIWACCYYNQMEFKGVLYSNLHHFYETTSEQQIRKNENMPRYSKLSYG